MPEDIKDSSLEESLQLLKDNPPVEPDKDELEDFQYESAKETRCMIKQLQFWKENVEELEEQLLVE